MSSSEATSQRSTGLTRSQNKETTTPPAAYDIEYDDSSARSSVPYDRSTRFADGNDDALFDQQHAQNFRAQNAKYNIVFPQRQQHTTAYDDDDGERRRPSPLQATGQHDFVVRPRRTYLSEEQKLSIVGEYYDLKVSHGLTAPDGDRAELPIFKYLWAKYGHLARTLNQYKKFRKSLLKWIRRYKENDYARIPDRRLTHPSRRPMLCDAMHAEVQRLLQMDLKAGCDMSGGVVMRRVQKVLDELRASPEAAEHQNCCLLRPFSLKMADREIRILYGGEEMSSIKSWSQTSAANPTLNYGSDNRGSSSSGGYAKRLIQLKLQQNARAVFARRAACVCISDIVREKLERERPGYSATEAEVPYIREQMQLLLHECKANGQHTACCVDPDKFTWKMAYDVRCRWKDDDNEKAEIGVVGRDQQRYHHPSVNGIDDDVGMQQPQKDEKGIGYRYYDDGEGFAFAEPDRTKQEKPTTPKLMGFGGSPPKRSQVFNVKIQPNKNDDRRLEAPLVDEDYAEDESDDDGSDDEAVEKSTSPVDIVVDEDYAEDEDDDDEIELDSPMQNRRIASPINQQRIAEQQQTISSSQKKRVSWNLNGNDTKYIDSAVPVRRGRYYDIEQPQEVRQPPPVPISNVNLLQLLSHAFDAADSCMQLLGSYSSFGMVSSLPENVRSSIATMLRGVEVELRKAAGSVGNEFDDDAETKNKTAAVPMSTLNSCLTMLKQTSQTMSLVCPRMQQPNARMLMVQTVKNLVDLSLQAL